MKRAAKITALALLVVLLSIIGAATWVINDEEFLRRQLETRVSESLGRELRVGQLELNPGKLTHLRLQDVQIANPAWATSSQMVSIGSLAATIDLSGLFDDQVMIESLEIAQAKLHLEEDAAGRANWSFATGEAQKSQTPRDTFIPWNHLRLVDFELAHSSPDRQVPLEFRVDDVSATKQPGGRVDLAGHGVIGGYDLSVDGFVDPLRAVFAGGKASHRITVELGEYRLASEGTVEDALTGRGARIEAKFSGPDFSWLLQQAALPEFSSGPFETSIRFDVASDRTVAMAVDGDLGSLEARATGTMDRLIDPAMLDLDFQVAGPDLESLGQALGIADLPGRPYRAEGGLKYENRSFEVRRLEAAFDSDRLSLSGRLGPWPALSGTVLDVSASGPDVSIWGPALGFQSWHSNPFSLVGRFAEAGGEVAVERAQLTLGQGVLQVDGRLGSPPDLLGARLDLELSVPDVSRVARLETLQLPRAPLRISGSLGRDRSGILVDGLSLAMLENTLVLSGLIALKPGSVPQNADEWRAALSGSHLTARVEAADARVLGELFGRPGLPPYPLAFELQAQLGDDALELGARDGHLGDARFGFAGSFALESGVRVRNATVSANGPEFRHFFDHEQLAGLPGRFRLEGSVVPGDGADHIESLSVHLGAMELAAEGEVQHLLEPQSGNLSIRFSVPELNELHPFLERYREGPLPGGPLSVEANVSGNRDLISLTEISAVQGESDLKGHLAISPGEAPEIVGSFESGALDLTWLNAKAQGSPEPPPAAVSASSQRVFSDEPLPLFRRDPIYVGVGLRAKALRLGLTTIHEVNLGLAITGDELSLEPLEFSGRMGERLSGRLFLRNREHGTQAEVQARAQGFRLGLALAEGQDIASAPPFDLLVDLKAGGATMKELATSAVGRIEWVAGAGQLANSRLDLIFSDVISELFQKLNPFVKESKVTHVDCGVALVNFGEGKARVDPLILQTDKIVATSTGTVDLGTETIDMSFNTRPMTGIGISPGVVINPFIRLGGTLARPSVTLDPAGAAVSGSAAVATAGLSLLGKSLYDRLLRGRDPCGKFVEELRRMHAEGAAEP